MVSDNQRLIMMGMAGLIEEGYTPREVLEKVDDIKRRTFRALIELEKEGEL